MILPNTLINDQRDIRKEAARQDVMGRLKPWTVSGEVLFTCSFASSAIATARRTGCWSLPAGVTAEWPPLVNAINALNETAIFNSD
ncbi:MAG: hypothetical protein U5R30_10295 [Deltaproteobacteria bacterium]|nr:hypothetical protein [Deltaproteobacteria bacterium]